MQDHIILLRGINVGTSTRIAMADLTRLVSDCGCENVITYIQSGNVIASSPLSAQALKERLEDALHARYAFPILVTLRSPAQIESLIDLCPLEWVNDDVQKTDVYFVMEHADPVWLNQLTIKKDIDDVLFSEADFIWHVTRDNQSRSGQRALLNHPLYKAVTIRNVNTLRKLSDLLKHR